MKISNSKKQLAKIIHENGGWRDGAEFAAQGGDHGHVGFASVAPVRHGKVWDMARGFAGKFLADEILPNWHQTILSREEYFHLYPAPDADGWIEWNGGECPVADGVALDVKYRDGDELTIRYPEAYRWNHIGSGGDFVAYRPHRPEQSKPEFCESVMRSIPEHEIHSKNTALTQVDDIDVVESKPTIEQLASDYRNAKDYADRKQQEADAAKADADEALAELVAAGKALGLVLSVAEPKSNPESELVIAWRDLRVGDEVKAVIPNGGLVESGSKGVVTSIRDSIFYSDFPEQRGYTYTKSHLEDGAVKFIRRP